MWLDLGSESHMDKNPGSLPTPADPIIVSEGDPTAAYTHRSEVLLNSVESSSSF